jgi:hypothetical protein
LASLIIEIGLDKKLAIEQIMQELTTVRLPSFVDSRAFHDALLAAVEAHLRTQLEARLDELRRNFGLPRPAPERVGLQPAETAVQTAGGSRVAAAPLAADADLKPANIVDSDQELPGDATLIWTTGSPRPKG